jgi:hypothetical protein
MTVFMEFVDRKQREAIKHLKLLEQLFKQSGMKVQNFIEEEEPYLFVYSPDERLSFDGIRIYEIGGEIAYRIQKEPDTQPYGRAYQLNLEEMFNDLMADNLKEEQAGKEVIKGVIEEIKKFFKKTAEAEAELEEEHPDGDQVMLRTGGTDYSNLVQNKM